jgi:hypothetical protein
MLVSGVLNPDTSGSYEQGADYAGYRTWTRIGGGWSIWWRIGTARWQLTPIIGTIPGVGNPFWIGPAGAGNPEGLYEAAGTATGDATAVLT